MDARFEFFDHTADIGIRVFAPTMAGLVPVAADGLYAVIGELETHGASEPATFDQRAADPAGLLRDYLAGLLLLFECESRVVVEPIVRTFDGQGLVVVGQSLAVDVERSVFLHEVKAITYHELELCEISGGYRASFIVDI